MFFFLWKQSRLEAATKSDVLYLFGQGTSSRGEGGDSHMKQTGLFMEKFELNP